MENYEVICQIGKGSFGLVQKIKRKSDGKILVWKEMNYGQMAEREKQQLVSEVNIIRDLRHPNIVRYYDRIIDKKQTKIFIIMEYCEGGDMGTLLKKSKRENDLIAEDAIWKIFGQIMFALNECHSRVNGKILHRDLKPANIFFDAANNIKLGDFGLSRIMGEHSVFATTNVGTPYYMSPEQIAEAKYNEKSDIWSAGCLLYELAALKPPFQAQNQLSLALKIKEGKFDRLPMRYSEDLQNLVERMLQTDSEKRPTVQSIIELPMIHLRLKEKKFRDKLAALKLKEDECKESENQLAARIELLTIRDARIEEQTLLVKKLESQIEELEKQLVIVATTTVSHNKRYPAYDENTHNNNVFPSYNVQQQQQSYDENHNNNNNKDQYMSQQQSLNSYQSSMKSLRSARGNSGLQQQQGQTLLTTSRSDLQLISANLSSFGKDLHTQQSQQLPTRQSQQLQQGKNGIFNLEIKKENIKQLIQPHLRNFDRLTADSEKVLDNYQEQQTSTNIVRMNNKSQLSPQRNQNNHMGSDTTNKSEESSSNSMPKHMIGSNNKYSTMSTQESTNQLHLTTTTTSQTIQQSYKQSPDSYTSPQNQHKNYPNSRTANGNEIEKQGAMNNNKLNPQSRVTITTRASASNMKLLNFQENKSESFDDQLDSNVNREDQKSEGKKQQQLLPSNVNNKATTTAFERYKATVAQVKSMSQQQSKLSIKKEITNTSNSPANGSTQSIPNNNSLLSNSSESKHETSENNNYNQKKHINSLNPTATQIAAKQSSVSTPYSISYRSQVPKEQFVTASPVASNQLLSRLRSQNSIDQLNEKYQPHQMQVQFQQSGKPISTKTHGENITNSNSMHSSGSTSKDVGELSRKSSTTGGSHPQSLTNANSMINNSNNKQSVLDNWKKQRNSTTKISDQIPSNAGINSNAITESNTIPQSTSAQVAQTGSSNNGTYWKGGLNIKRNDSSYKENGSTVTTNTNASVTTTSSSYQPPSTTPHIRLVQQQQLMHGQHLQQRNSYGQLYQQEQSPDRNNSFVGTEDTQSSQPKLLLAKKSNTQTNARNTNSFQQYSSQLLTQQQSIQSMNTASHSNMSSLASTDKKSPASHKLLTQPSRSMQSDEFVSRNSYLTSTPKTATLAAQQLSQQQTHISEEFKKYTGRKLATGDSPMQFTSQKAYSTNVSNATTTTPNTRTTFLAQQGSDANHKMQKSYQQQELNFYSEQQQRHQY